MVQIHSPRPILLNSTICKQQNGGRPPGNAPGAEISAYRSKVRSISEAEFRHHVRRKHRPPPERKRPSVISIFDHLL